MWTHLLHRKMLAYGHQVEENKRDILIISALVSMATYHFTAVLGFFTADCILSPDNYEVSSSSLIYPLSETCS